MRRLNRAHKFKVRVYYEDTDFTGLVYHANYLRFAERGRSDYLRSLGITHRALLGRSEPLAFVVRRLEASFEAAARVEDDLVVASKLLAARGARLEMAQEITCGDVVLWRAVVVLAVIRMGARAAPRAGEVPRAARIPSDLMKLFEAAIE